VKLFDQISLYLLVMFAAGGLIAPFLLAAKHRQPALAVAALVIGAWVVVTLISSAVLL
jgi:hypothetical protein